MNCPQCNYLMSDLDLECPRCKLMSQRQQRAATESQAEHHPAPEPSAASADSAPRCSGLGGFSVVDSSSSQQAVTPNAVQSGAATVVQVQQNSSGTPWWVFLLIFGGPLGCLFVPVLIFGGMMVLTIAAYLSPLLIAGIVSWWIWYKHPGRREERVRLIWIVMIIGAVLTLIWLLTVFIVGASGLLDDDYGPNSDFQVVINRCWETQRVGNNYMFYTADAGKKYLIVNVTVTNKSSRQQFVTGISMRLVSHNKNLYSGQIFPFSDNRILPFSATLLQGGSATGDVVFEVDKMTEAGSIFVEQ